jgi:hypothetical protein
MYYKRIQEKLSDLNSYDIISMYNHSRIHPNSVSVKETSEEKWVPFRSFFLAVHGTAELDFRPSTFFMGEHFMQASFK